MELTDFMIYKAVAFIVLAFAYGVYRGFTRR